MVREDGEPEAKSPRLVVGLTMARPRQGSRKSKVYDYLRMHGPEETISFGVSLGLAEGTVCSWIGGWKNEPQKTRVGVKRVVAKYWPGRFGIVVDEGPEVSEVRWDDGSTADRFIANYNLRPPRR